MLVNVLITFVSFIQVRLWVIKSVSGAPLVHPAAYSGGGMTLPLARHLPDFRSRHPTTSYANLQSPHSLSGFGTAYPDSPDLLRAVGEEGSIAGSAGHDAAARSRPGEQEHRGDGHRHDHSGCR